MKSGRPSVLLVGGGMISREVILPAMPGAGDHRAVEEPFPGRAAAVQAGVVHAAAYVHEAGFLQRLEQFACHRPPRRRKNPLDFFQSNRTAF
jgi:hypothetical protein